MKYEDEKNDGINCGCEKCRCFDPLFDQNCGCEIAGEPAVFRCSMYDPYPPKPKE